MANPVMAEEGKFLPEYGEVTEADLRRAAWRHNLTLQWSWNYERMQALGYLWAMMPILQRRSKTKEELIANMQRHLVFYNTNPAVGSPLIFGASAAMEQKDQGEVGDSLKIALMGPMAGIGDTLMAILIRPIVAVISTSIALGGSVVGPLLEVLLGFFYFWQKFPQFWWGHRQGVGLISHVTGGALHKITEAATVMGLIVVGGFIPSIMARLSTKVKFAQTVTVDGQATEKVIELQPVLDQLLPYMLPLLTVGFAYWLIKGRKQSPMMALLWLTILSFVLSYAKIM